MASCRGASRKEFCTEPNREGMDWHEKIAEQREQLPAPNLDRAATKDCRDTHSEGKIILMYIDSLVVADVNITMEFHNVSPAFANELFTSQGLSSKLKFLEMATRVTVDGYVVKDRYSPKKCKHAIEHHSLGWRAVPVGMERTRDMQAHKVFVMPATRQE
jgi:hypothetical protein